jgi:hypothetical protein
MFVEEEKQDKSGESHLPPIDWKWGMCDSQSPDARRWICTRHDGHEGIHRAGSDMWTWTAEWDDDRSTDPADMKTEYEESNACPVDV